VAGVDEGRWRCGRCSPTASQTCPWGRRRSPRPAQPGPDSITVDRTASNPGPSSAAPERPPSATSGYLRAPGGGLPGTARTGPVGSCIVASARDLGCWRFPGTDRVSPAGHRAEEWLDPAEEFSGVFCEHAVMARVGQGDRGHLRQAVLRAAGNAAHVMGGASPGAHEQDRDVQVGELGRAGRRGMTIFIRPNRSTAGARSGAPGDLTACRSSSRVQRRPGNAAWAAWPS
jgi:hypothetical protein